MIKIRKSTNGQYYFTVHAKNGAVLVTSEMYTRKANILKVMGQVEDVLFWNRALPEKVKLIDTTEK